MPDFEPDSRKHRYSVRLFIFPMQSASVWGAVAEDIFSLSITFSMHTRVCVCVRERERERDAFESQERWFIPHVCGQTWPRKECLVSGI